MELILRDWYDDQGYELNPDTGRRLTDTEIDAEWDALGVNPGVTTDIPVPDGGFPDPDTWEPLVLTPRGKSVSRKQLLKDIATHGRKATAAYWGVDPDQLPGYSPDTAEEQEGEDWHLATKRFRRRAERVLTSVWIRQRPADKKLVEEALKRADLKWDLSGDAEAAFDLAEDHT